MSLLEQMCRITVPPPAIQLCTQNIPPESSHCKCKGEDLHLGISWTRMCALTEAKDPFSPAHWFCVRGARLHFQRRWGHEGEGI